MSQPCLTCPEVLPDGPQQFCSACHLRIPREIWELLGAAEAVSLPGWRFTASHVRSAIRQHYLISPARTAEPVLNISAEDLLKDLGL